MKLFKISSIIFVLLFLWVGIHYASIPKNKPLIFFTSNKYSKWSIYFANYMNLIQGKRVCVIVTENPKSYDSVRQLVQFLSLNVSKHNSKRKTPWMSYEDYVRPIFHEGETLYLSCGKTAFLLSRLLNAKFSFSQKELRLVDVWSSESVKESAAGSSYLEGSHEFLEAYFPSLKKWIGLDAWSGIILEKDKSPLSLLEVALLPNKEISFSPLGKNELVKGPNSKEATDKYFRNARKIFGYRAGRGKWVVLFLRPPEFIPQFKLNCEKIYRNKFIIFTDPKKFASLIGVKITSKQLAKKMRN